MKREQPSPRWEAGCEPRPRPMPTPIPWGPCHGCDAWHRGGGLYCTRCVAEDLAAAVPWESLTAAGLALTGLFHLVRTLAS